MVRERQLDHVVRKVGENEQEGGIRNRWKDGIWKNIQSFQAQTATFPIMG